MPRLSPSARPIAGLLGLAALLAPGAASAADLGGGTIEFELQLPDADGNYAPRDDLSVLEYFNVANCVCPDTNFAVKLTLANADTPESVPVDIWVGVRCDDPDPRIRDENCELITTIPEVEDLRSPDRIEIPVGALLATQSTVCEEREVTRTVYAIIDPADDGVGEGDNVFSLDVFADTQPPPAPTDLEVSGAEEAVVASWDLPESRTEDIRYFQLLCAGPDGQPVGGGVAPRYLTSEMACGVDDGVTPQPPQARVTWLGGTGDAGTGDAGVEPDAGGPAPDGGTTGEPLPEGLRTLDPAFICGEAGGTETSIRGTGLENGVPYRLVLAVVDPSRNVTAIDLGTQTPQPVVDGWERYKDAGGQAQGDYCFIATASYGDLDHPMVVVLRDFRDGTLAKFGLGRAFIRWYYASSPPLAAFIADHPAAAAATRVLLAPVVVLAGFWEYTGALGKLGALAALLLTVHLRRRRRARRAAQPPRRSRRRTRLAVAAATAAALALAFEAAASAQPYWDEYNQPVQAEVGRARPSWNFEIKVGPYVPAVDSEFDLADDEAGPFEEIYGDGPFVMTQLQLDRYFVRAFGQLGISASIGYMSRSAGALEVDDMGDVVVGEDGEPVRAAGDDTTFRLIPTSLQAVYRFTWLDDRYRVPLVPYGRAGLSYYIWSFEKPGGGASEAPTPMCPNPGGGEDACAGDRGRGGTLGWQASVGLAVRAERIDPDAETSLRTELGIEHAGFFAELTYANVDGFGSGDKLVVGDLTWFGGINFEF